MASPLQRVNDSNEIFSTFKTFKAFKLKIDCYVAYIFKNEKLKAVVLIPSEKPGRRFVDTVVKELSDIYRKPPYVGYDEDGNLRYLWDISENLTSFLLCSSDGILRIEFWHGISSFL